MPALLAVCLKELLAVGRQGATDRFVTGRKKDEADGKDNSYIYRGIATRSFERRFALADHIQVKGADMKDGLLSIELVREIPEAMKPKKISIGESQPAIEAEAANA